MHGLDLLNTAEFEQLRARLGPDYKALTPQAVNERIRTTTEYASVLFYFDVNIPKHGTVFYSSNLHGQAIPDVPKQHRYDTSIPGIGPLRVQLAVAQPKLTNQELLHVGAGNRPDAERNGSLIEGAIMPGE